MGLVLCVHIPFAAPRINLWLILRHQRIEDRIESEQKILSPLRQEFTLQCTRVAAKFLVINQLLLLVQISYKFPRIICNALYIDVSVSSLWIFVKRSGLDKSFAFKMIHCLKRG